MGEVRGRSKDRDSNEHGQNLRNITGTLRRGEEPVVSAEELAPEITSKLYPFEGDRRMLDFSTENIYTMHMAKLIARHSRWEMEVHQAGRQVSRQGKVR